MTQHDLFMFRKTSFINICVFSCDIKFKAKNILEKWDNNFWVCNLNVRGNIMPGRWIQLPNFFEISLNFVCLVTF